MKKLVLVAVVFISVLSIKAQEDQERPYEMKTLFGNGNSNGFYGGLSAGYAEVGSRSSVLMGGRGAWIINHRLALGFAGNGFVSDFRFDQALNSDAFYSGGYGGLLIEPIFFPEMPVHFTIPVVVGAGGIAYSKKFDDWHKDDHNDYTMEEGEPFFFVKPGVEVEMNLLKFMRLSLGAYYMQTSKVSIVNGSSGMLNGFSGLMTLKFGKF